MDYSEARAAFFSPREETPPGPGFTSPARALRDAIEPLATVCYWAEPAYEEYAALGLDFLGGYVHGRSSPLGDVAPEVAGAAFGVFEPGLIADLLRAARQICGREEVAAARLRGSVAVLREVLGEPEGVEGADETAAGLETLAAGGDVMGRALYAGLRATPAPQDLWGRIWHACTTLREYRGDTHLAALAAHDVDGLEGNLLTELWVGWEPLSYTATPGWSPEAMDAATRRLEARGLVAGGALTDEGDRLRTAIETSTDAGLNRMLAGFDGDLDALTARCAAWGDAVVARGWFPPDPLKRAAG